MGLLKRIERDGLSFGYMKPVSVSAVRTTQTVLDEDAALIRTMFRLETPLEQMVPVPITSTLIDTVLRGETHSFEENLRTAYENIARDREVVVLEGSNTWAEGALVDLTSDKVIEMLGAPCLLVARYHSLHSLDAVLTVKRYIGDNMLGVLINQVDLPQVEFVHNQIVPFLESRQIPVYGVLPQDRLLASVPVNDLIEHLGGHMIGQPEWCDRMVESLMIGSMGSAEALSFLRRRPNKAVILGGDRVDFQLVALDTSTNLLILTGNIQPSPRVIDRAEERRVPILAVPDDTLTTVERAEQLFGRVRFHEPAKMQRFTSLMDEHFDFERLYKALGVPSR
jgi:hypothetical protein